MSKTRSQSSMRLAKRQEELANQQRNPQQSFQERWQQEMLRREAEQLQRQMEQLAQNSQGQQKRSTAERSTTERPARLKRIVFGTVRFAGRSSKAHRRKAVPSHRGSNPAAGLLGRPQDNLQTSGSSRH